MGSLKSLNSCTLIHTGKEADIVFKAVG